MSFELFLLIYWIIGTAYTLFLLSDELNPKHPAAIFLCGVIFWWTWPLVLLVHIIFLLCESASRS
jgi:hypothetical protein